MSRATSDDQLKFLLSCVKHSNNGKIDFVEVAQECGVVSKGAAAKRYERLMKANGINPNGGPDPRPLPVSTPKVPKSNQTEGTAKPPAKRRRTNKTATTVTLRKKEKPVTPEPNIEQTSYVKTEDKSNSLPNSFPLPQPINNQLGSAHQNESSFDFDEFCSPEMFEQCASDANHMGQRALSAPALVSKMDMETPSASRVEEMPQLVQHHVKIM